MPPLPLIDTRLIPLRYLRTYRRVVRLYRINGLAPHATPGFFLYSRCAHVAGSLWVGPSLSSLRRISRAARDTLWSSAPAGARRAWL